MKCHRGRLAAGPRDAPAFGEQLLRAVLAEVALPGGERRRRPRRRHAPSRPRRASPRPGRGRARPRPRSRARSPATATLGDRRGRSRQHRDGDLAPGRPSRRYEKWSGDVGGAHAAVVECVDAAPLERDADRRRECRRRAARRRVRPSTSGPRRATSRGRGRRRRTRTVPARMHGPRYARTGAAPIARSAATAASITPARGPRWPACTTPTASSHASTIGAQSAVTTASGKPRTAVTAASASGGVGAGRSGGDVHLRRRAPDEPHPPVGVGSPAAAATRSRLRGDRRRVVTDVVADVARVVRRREIPPRRSLHQTRAGPSVSRALSGLSAGTRGRRSRRRRGRVRPRRRASPRRRDRARARRPDALRRAARPRSGRSRPRSP